jgi:hypothetical protein
MSSIAKKFQSLLKAVDISHIFRNLLHTRLRAIISLAMKTSTNGLSCR